MEQLHSRGTGCSAEMCVSMRVISNILIPDVESDSGFSHISVSFSALHAAMWFVSGCDICVQFHKHMRAEKEVSNSRL